MKEKSEVSLLVVDDDNFVLETTVLLLKEYGYHVFACSSAEEGLARFQQNGFTIVLTDIKMPGMSGIDLLGKIHDVNKEIPVILMTAYTEFDTAVEAIKKGALDFIIKPFKPEYLYHAVDKAVDHYRLVQIEKGYKKRLEKDVKERTAELADALRLLKNTSKEIVYRLTSISEFRDTETGAHIKRIGLYAAVLAKRLNISDEVVEAITFASPMHDIGKIGIPDNILLKPGLLTPEEFVIMKTHTTTGSKMLAGSSYPMMEMAARIALTHHEKWDGSGYPMGLTGDRIPREGIITMLCDIYDALRSRRPYKKPYGHEEASKIILEGDGRTKPEHFDPEVLKVFIEAMSEFDQIFNEHQD